ncbi:uncharacterized protein LOC144125879 isoform X2 [Amblyomma americanum]
MHQRVACVQSFFQGGRRVVMTAAPHLGSAPPEVSSIRKEVCPPCLHPFCADSSSESSAGDDEWRPCRRKIVRRVNPQRSQATKLMWQRKKAAALLLQQQQQEDEYGTGPSSVSGFSSHNQGDSAAILPLSSVGTDPSSTVSAKQSVSTLRMQPPQLPLRKRHIQTRTSDDGFSMCWSDTTLGSSLAGKSSVRTEDSRSNGSHPASRGGLKAYHHVTCQSATTTTAAASTASVASTPTVTATATTAAAAAAVATAVAAGSSRTGAEVPISQPVINGGNARLGLARACRPKVLKEEPTSSSEHSDDDCAAASLARRYEHLASSPVRQLLEGGPRLRPRLMRTVPPQLGEQEFCVAHSSPIKIEDEPHRSQAMMTVPHHLYRGNSGLKSELLVQGQSVPSTDPCTSKLMPLSSSQCKPWGENLQEHQHALQEEAAADKAQGSSGSVQYARESNGTQQQLPSLLTMSFPFKLPAKLRWKQKMAAERLQGVLPPKLRHKQHMPLWAAGGEADVTANLQAVVKIEPGTAGGAGMLETAPLVPVIKTEHKEPPSERRSQAKRQWWQQVKQLDRLAASGDSTSPEKAEEILSTLPKFLLAELFPDPKTRGKKPKAPVKVEGTPSRRSLIMKESWRRRKAAWLSAAENSLAAAFRPGSTSANKDPTSSGNSSIVVKEEPVEPEEPVPHNSSISGNSGIVVKKEPEEPAVPGEPGPAEESTQYLARTRALRRCRQYRQNLIAQADFQQSSRPLRHYNARGIHITGNKDMCDCLRLECPGCHFPCPKCGSSKCGDECRCNRNYTYEQIEIDGRPGIVYVNPLLS